MKKLVFENMKELKKGVDLFEQHGIEYSWYFLNKKYEIHLGTTNVDHVKLLLRETGKQLKFKWDEYYW
ncbi:MAG: hypothetical protein HN356_02790 [Calditrichaeota bacterium]|jgi:hypothetical protein|nr:hypothetical protein [Calditrichota bacterium]MBT7788536.1 hypothetical protein [Calditrichota bacterium]